MKDFIDLMESLKRQEGLRCKPYKCTSGKLTIGYGRNLEDVGISQKEAEYLFENDVRNAINQLYSRFDWVADLPNEIQHVLINMTFQMGIGGLSSFRKFLAALQAKNYAGAASEMMDSKWARQTPNRARELARIVVSYINK